VQRGGERGPHGQVAAFLEQRGGQQQVDHHTGGQLAQPLLHGPALGQCRVDHLERDDLRQLAQVARGEKTVGYCDLAGDDTLTGQRSSRGERLVLADKPFYRGSASHIRRMPRSTPLARHRTVVNLTALR
jgi:hypothetical protein